MMNLDEWNECWRILMNETNNDESWWMKWLMMNEIYLDESNELWWILINELKADEPWWMMMIMMIDNESL